MSILGQYQNGNYGVTILSDGTKIRENDLDFFDAEFPESMDIKITNVCDMGCPMCHEDSKPNGKHGDILNLPFLDSLHEFTELAIGGGNPLAHPDFIPFLHLLKGRKLIANVTVNEVHFLQNIPLLLELTEQGLIYGMGISYTGGDRENTYRFADEVSKFPNAVIHIIAGIVSAEQIHWLSERSHNLKILILGYKDFRRGADYYEKVGQAINERLQDLYELMPEMIDNKYFKTISFDNLAISQLDVKLLLTQEIKHPMTEEEWQTFFMGDDGRDGELTSASMYVDAVSGQFSKNSCSTERFPVTSNITEMFQFLRKKEGKNSQ